MTPSATVASVGRERARHRRPRRRGRVLLLAVALVVAAGGSAWLAGLTASTASGRPASRAAFPTARPFGGLPQVGAIFRTGARGRHFCSGSVVASPAGDLVLTAAHCVVGNGHDLVFVPGYAAGRAPYGTWSVRAAYVDPTWLRAANPQADVAFLRVAPHVVHGRTEQVQDLVGGDRLTTDAPYRQPTLVVGYADGSGDDPLRCTATTGRTGGYPTFDCNGFVDGTSGSPWLVAVDPRTGTGTVDGVIGGLDEGGCAADISFSSYFGARVAALYARAVAGGPGDLVTAPAAGVC